MDDQLSRSLFKNNKDLDYASERKSRLSLTAKEHNQELGDEYFSDEDNSKGTNEEERQKILRFLDNFENFFSILSLWLAHGIIGFIPIILTVNGYISIFIAVPISTCFMIFMFAKFIYNEGIKFLKNEGIDINDFLKNDKNNSPNKKNNSPMMRLDDYERSKKLNFYT